MNKRVYVRSESAYRTDVEVDIVVDADAYEGVRTYTDTAAEYDPDYFECRVEDTTDPVTVCNAKTARDLVSMVFDQSEDYRV